VCVCVCVCVCEAWCIFRVMVCNLSLFHILAVSLRCIDLITLVERTCPPELLIRMQSIWYPSQRDDDGLTQIRTKYARISWWLVPHPHSHTISLMARIWSKSIVASFATHKLLPHWSRLKSIWIFLAIEFEWFILDGAPFRMRFVFWAQAYFSYSRFGCNGKLIQGFNLWQCCVLSPIILIRCSTGRIFFAMLDLGWFGGVGDYYFAFGP